MKLGNNHFKACIFMQIQLFFCASLEQPHQFDQRLLVTPFLYVPKWNLEGVMGRVRGRVKIPGLGVGYRG